MVERQTPKHLNKKIHPEKQKSLRREIKFDIFDIH